MVERILLYYPAISIPNKQWLRQAILYTDKVSSMVPFESVNDGGISDELKMLYDEGQYQPIYVFNEIAALMPVLKEFEQNFREAIEGEAFQNMQKSVVGYNRNNILGVGDLIQCIQTLTPETARFLKERQLMGVVTSIGGIEVEKTTAAIYASMLAETLASINKDLVIPSTDQQVFETLSFQMGKTGYQTHRLAFQNCLPSPGDDVDLVKIVKFKQKRYAELLAFRKEIDGLENDLKTAESDEDRKLSMVKFSEGIQTHLIDIQRLLGESRMDWVLKSFSSLLDFKKKEIVGTIGTLGIAGAGVVAHLPLAALGAGAAVLTGTIISSFRNINRTVQGNSFGYVYYAEKEGLVGV